MFRSRLAPSIVLACALGAPAPFVHAQGADSAETSATESWTGSAMLPGGAELGFSITITRGDTPSATIDIPAQSALGIPLEVISLEGDSVLLRIPAPANAEIAGTVNDQGELAGMLKQAGMEFPFKMSRSSGEPALARPQHPEPPYPYTVEGVTFENAPAGVTLAGTLTLPDGDGPFPAAVLVSGSGPQDRDETLVGHKPFLVLADHLTRAGIAVLRYDERGVGDSSGDFATALTDDFADDALAGVAFLMKDPRIASDRVGLIGHSEGGLVAPMAAAGDASVAYIVMLAGLGVDGGEILVSQQIAITSASGSDELAASVGRHMQAMVEAMRSGDDTGMATSLRDVLRAQMVGATDQQVDDTLAQQIKVFGSPWMRRFVELNPADYLSRVSQPTLAMFGSLDLQVLPSINAEGMRAALASAPTDDVTIVTFPGLNHLFQTAETGAPSEYAMIEETFNETALDLVSSWITQRFED